MDTKVVTPKVVKKYANRKLYDTETSKYTTLKAIAEEVAAGREVQVIDNGTKTDVTGEVLLMALVETDADITGQTTTLRDILRAGGLNKFVQTLKGTVTNG